MVVLYTELEGMCYIGRRNDPFWMVSELRPFDNLDKHLIHLNSDYL